MPLKTIGDRFVLQQETARQGGMGTVFKALDVTDGATCGIKTLGTTMQVSPLHELAMTRDLEALESLRHPNIVSLISHGKDEELGPYFAMEWLETDLKTKCQQTPYLSWQAFWQDVGRPILGALCYAYAKKRVHRDLKPANIMFKAPGEAKLIDFGISGVLEALNLGATLRAHKSGAYSPPEEQPKDSLRDVYGFAATAVYALTGAEPENYEELQSTFEKIDWPQCVGQILARCLASDPDDRPDSVLELRELLDRTTTEDETEPASQRQRPITYIKLSRKVEQQLHEMEPPYSLARVVADLNELCYIENPAYVVSHDSNRIVLVTSQLAYVIARESSNPGLLVVISARETRPSSWSYAQDRSLRIAVQFREGDRVGRAEQSERVIDELLAALAAHADQIGAGDQSIFEIWRTVLRGKAEYYGRKYPAMFSPALHTDGARIIARLAEPPDENLVGLSYSVDDGVARVAVGQVESVQDDSVVLYCTAPFDAQALREGGWLRYNASGTERAIRHQESAIERVQSGQSPNLGLAKLIIEPALAAEPVRVDYQPLVPGIDGDKQSAACAALGADSVFLVVGPPGTGKTEFITELVLQELQRKPDIRILLTAQTHMAVDSALTRLRQATSDISFVRLGRPNDRISRESNEFLLEKIAPAWRATVARRSLEALDAYGKEHGVEVARLRSSRAAQRAFNEDQALADCELRLAAVNDELVRTRELQTSESGQQTSKIDALEDAVLALKSEVASQLLRSAEAKTDLYQLGEAALKVFEELVEKRGEHAATTTNEQVDGVLTVINGWLQRLSASQEFFPAILAESQVIAGTCLGFIGVPGTSEIEYDLAIVEEASRALPSEVLVPASRAKRVVLVGDRKQLPPFLESDLQDVEWLEANSLTRAEVSETLFDRLELRLPPTSVARLKMQYRMDKSIGDLVGRVFYPGALQSAPGAGSKKVSLTQLGFERNVLLVSTSREPDRKEQALEPGFANPGEARVIRAIVQGLIRSARKRRKEGFSIVVLAPYIGQTTALEQAIADLRSEARTIEIDVHTVHTFQGRQADIAIYSCVRTEDLGFTSDARLVNVAISRGQGGLIIVGDTRFLEGNRSSTAYRDIIKYIQSNPSACNTVEARNVR
ncbi:MAG: AAA domain-containing protein [Tahibacter sp.]